MLYYVFSLFQTNSQGVQAAKRAKEDQERVRRGPTTPPGSGPSSSGPAGGKETSEDFTKDCSPGPSFWMDTPSTEFPGFTPTSESKSKEEEHQEEEEEANEASSDL